MRINLQKIVPLDALMREQGVSDAELARRTGFTAMSIHRWRHDKVVTSAATAKKLLTALGVSEDLV